MNERIFDVGQPVVWVNEVGLPRPAIITAIHGDEYENDGKMYYPCINLVSTSGDDSKTDPYGRQIERFTSISHKSTSTAHGFYWRWFDEEPNPVNPNTRV